VTAQRVLFVGISTGRSLIHRVFPAWMALLGVDAELEGIDLRADTADTDYRALVERLGADAQVRGAVITSHKLGVHRAARDLLAAGDPYVDLLHEVNVIVRRPDGALTAYARDPLAVEALLPALLAGGPPPDEVLCLGAGGAGVAVLVSLLFARDGAALVPHRVGPRRVVMSDTRSDRLQAVGAMLDALPATAAEVQLAPADDNDGELARLTPGALVVNATGLGKDTPGSPVSAGARFPPDAVVWDVNYRGDLAFLALARAQRPALRVHDGWSYFLHGWAQALGPILGRPLDGELFGRLAEVAERLRDDR
jgi:shikimate 5-dehydrogenase